LPTGPDQPSGGPRVAVAIVSWNTSELLRRCLSSLRAEHDAGIAEVWVVDNASQDGSADLVRDNFKWARLIEPGRNVGFGPAVNLVAERTTTPWIAPANADTQVTPGAIEALLEAGEANPGAGAIAPRLRLPDGSTQHSVYAFPTLSFTALVNFGGTLSDRLSDRLCLEGHWDADRPRDVDWAIAALILVRRTAWDEVGGFSDEQWMYAEDLDLGWRLHRAGWSTRYVPEAVVRHESGASTRQVWGDAASQWILSTYAWMLWRRGATITRLVALTNVIGAGARWAAFGLLALARRGPWSERRDAMRRWAALHSRGLRSRRKLREHR
jgi:N-acetylglucosaminyl-diphospho-decaprenol L-rhamnosyltransferase